MLQQPYRARVLRLIPVGDRIELENYTIQDVESFYGAARDLNQLSQLTRDRLTLMPHCNMHIEWTGNSFVGQVEPGNACMVERQGKMTYLDNKFEINGEKFLSWDRGRDPDTHEHVWGSLAGPFDFARRASFADEVVLG